EKKQLLANLDRFFRETLQSLGDLRGEVIGAKPLRTLCREYLGLENFGDIARYVVEKGYVSGEMPDEYTPKSQNEYYLDSEVVGEEWFEINSRKAMSTSKR